MLKNDVEYHFTEITESSRRYFRNGILTFIGMINDCLWDLNLKFPTILAISIFMSILDFMLR